MDTFNRLCKLYNEMKLEVSIDGKNISWPDMVGNNVCPLAFHSVYAYMKTVSRGGWFNWVDYAGHVIVHCPSPEGIAMHVKAPDTKVGNKIVVEVIKTDPECYKSYAIAHQFVFDFKEGYEFHYKAIDRMLSGFPLEQGETCACTIDGKDVHCRMKL
ncbi:MAG: hypothetical protein ABII23_05415 [bacterium]